MKSISLTFLASLGCLILLSGCASTERHTVTTRTVQENPDGSVTITTETVGDIDGSEIAGIDSMNAEAPASVMPAYGAPSARPSPYNSYNSQQWRQKKALERQEHFYRVDHGDYNSGALW